MNNLIRRNVDNRSVAASRDAMPNPYQLLDAVLRWNAVADERPGARGNGFSPAFEVREAKDAFIIKADVPGLADHDVDVTVAGNAVTVSGRRDPDPAEDSDAYYAMERGFGAFSRTFGVSDGADLQNLTADLSNGVLTLRIPKRREVQPRKISVGNGNAPGKASA
jgi:HSP20 family protein